LRCDRCVAERHDTGVASFRYRTSATAKWKGAVVFRVDG